MSLGLVLARLQRLEDPAHTEATLTESWARGQAWYSDRETRTTGLVQVACPECGGGVRLLPVAVQCAAGCGWERWRS